MDNGYGICLNEWIEDDKLKNELRLLIKISSLTARLGYCYASNEYFSEYFNTSTVTISRQINKLIKLNYISAEYTKKGSVVDKRVIRLISKTTVIKNDNDRYQKCYPTVIKNVKDNSISINSISINKEKDINLKGILPKETKKEKHIKETLDYPIPENEWIDVWSEWMSYRKAQKIKSWSRLIDEQRAVNKLVNLSNGDVEIAKKIIIQSIENGYTGLFKLKNQNKNEQATDFSKSILGY